MSNELIDRIYESSFVPELWPSVLDEVARLTEMRGGILFAARGKVLNWTTSAALKEIFSSYIQDGWFAKCSRRVCLYSGTMPVFVGEHDYWTDAELDANPIYRDFFRPQGLGWSAGTGVTMLTGDHIVFSMERENARGPVERERIAFLNELRPHLARAALVAARLGLQSAKGASGTLEQIGLPALVLDEAGHVVEANALMEGLTGHVKWRALGKAGLADAAAGEQLEASLAAIGKSASAGVHSFPLRDEEGKAALVAHVIPVRRTAHDIFARSYALLVLMPVTVKKSLPIELLRTLFDLTQSEARVARGLAAGESIDEIAESGGVGRNTVRSQVQQVLEKTGCARQAEVVALLSNVAIERGPANGKA